MASSTRPATDAEWDRHKAIIHSLFLCREASMAELVTELTGRGLVVTKAQLEYKLKQWDFRRNITSEAWKYVGHQVGKRKRQGKESDVVVSGARLKQRKVDRSIRRNFVQSLADKFKPPPSPPPPEGIGTTVCTPPPNHMEFLSWPTNLPWFQFQLLTPTISFLQKSIAVLPQTSSTTNPISLFGYPGAQSNHGLSQAAAVIGTIMPEAHQGENLTRAVALISGSGRDKLEESLKTTVYMFSNNLFEFDNFADRGKRKEMFQTFSTLFQRIGRMQMPSLNHSVKGSHTSKAFATNFLGFLVTDVLDHSGGELEILEWLLRSEADPNTTVMVSYNYYDEDSNPETVTLLQHAASFGFVSVTRLLIKFGADVNLVTETLSDTPLLLTLQCGRDSSAMREIVAMLLAAGAGRIPEKLDAPLLKAAAFGAAPLVELLDNYGADFESRSSNNSDSFWVVPTHTALSSAAAGNLGTIKYILGRSERKTKNRDRSPGVDPDALFVAIWEGNIKVVQYLVTLGPDLRSHNRTGITPLQLAVVSKTAKKDILCQLLLQNGGDLHKRVEGSPSALQLTAMQGDAELMEVLLQNGANVNNYSALDPGHAFLREKTAVEMLFRLRDSYMYEEEDWIQGARECAQTFLRDTIYRLPAPDPLSIVVSCRDFIGTQGEAWGETSRYDRCGALLQQHGCRGTRFFPRDMTPERAEAALAHGVHSENITIEGFPSLLWAIRNGNAKLCSAFLGDRTTLSADETVEVFQANQFNLIYTLARERPSLCMFNLSQRSSVGQPVLTTAVLNSSPEAMSILKNWASAYDGSKLVLAVKIALVAARNMWLLERLLNNRSQHQEPTNSEGSSIAIAALDAGKGVLDLLLEHLPPVERCDLFNESLDSGFRWEFQYLRRTLLVPVKLRDHGLLEKFLNKGYKADGHVLSGAVETEDLSMVGSILARGLVASLDATGPLPLAVAVLRANISMIQLLLRHGVDVNAEPRAHWGRSALQQAVEIGNLEIIQFLLDRGADVNCPPAPLGGATALQVAAIKGFLGIAKLLLDQDPPANINAPGAGTYGRTALEGAAENGRIDMVQLLLTSGVEATDSQYLRAISLARSCGHDVAAAILEENRELTADKVGALGN